MAADPTVEVRLDAAHVCVSAAEAVAVAREGGPPRRCVLALRAALAHAERWEYEHRQREMARSSERPRRS